MRLLRHWKMIIGLAALFAAGCVTGAVALLTVAINHPSPDQLNRWVNFRFKEYEHRLKLTPEQRSKIRPVVQSTRDQIRAVVRNGLEQTIPILGQAQQQIQAELTPSQRVEFDKINHEVLKRLRDFQQKEAAAEASASAVPPSAKPQ